MEVEVFVFVTFLAMVVGTTKATGSVQTTPTPSTMNAFDCQHWKPAGATATRFHQGTCYAFFAEFQDRATYGDARTKCHHDLGGTLALPKSRETNAFLSETLRDSFVQRGPYWIGLASLRVEGKIVWDDGTPLDPVRDFNDLPRMLPEFTSQDACIAMSSSGWHVYRCFGDNDRSKNNFICQVRKIPVSTTTTTITTATATTTTTTTASPIAPTITSGSDSRRSTTAPSPSQPLTSSSTPPTITTTTTTLTTSTTCPPDRCDDVGDCDRIVYKPDPVTGCFACSCLQL